MHQLNCTYYAALDCDDDRYVAARAIQLFARGVPQIYYVGLLAGENDHAAVVETGEGRAINRHNYRADEIESALRRPVVGRLLDLIRLRNTHPAFDGAFRVDVHAGQIPLSAMGGSRGVVRAGVELTTGRATVDDGGDRRAVLSETMLRGRRRLRAGRCSFAVTVT